MSRELIDEARRWPNPDGVAPASAAANLIARLADALEESDLERASLASWKRQAMAVLDAWEETWKAAGRPGRLGTSKAVAVREARARLEAEIREALDRTHPDDELVRPILTNALKGDES